MGRLATEKSSGSGALRGIVRHSKRTDRLARRALKGTHARLFGDLKGIYRWLNRRMGEPLDLKTREFPLAAGGRALLVFMEGLANTDLIDRDLLGPLLSRTTDRDLLDRLTQVAQYQPSRSWSEVLTSLLAGNAILFLKGENRAFIFDVNKLPHRSISGPETERAIKGSREAFTELLLTNVNLIRRRVRDASLRIESQSIGRQSGTAVAMVYLENLANPAVVKTVRERLAGVDLPQVSDANVIQGYLEDNPNSLFPQVRAIETVDMAARALWRGQVLVMIDNSAFQLIVPATIWDFYVTTNDYGVSWGDASLTRIVRAAAWIIGLYGPPLYIALTSVDPDLLPSKLLMVIAGSSQNIAFPPALEALVMYGIIEVLREAAIRLPQGLSTTLGTVGAVVVGTAIVKAGLVDSMMIIVITMTSLASFTVPAYDMIGPWRILVWVMMFAALFMGLYGILVATFFLFVHLASLSSVGVPYLAPYGPLRPSDLKDSLLRLPLSFIHRRPTSYRPQKLNLGKRVWRDPPRNVRRSKDGDR